MSNVLELPVRSQRRDNLLRQLRAIMIASRVYDSPDVEKATGAVIKTLLAELRRASGARLPHDPDADADPQEADGDQAVVLSFEGHVGE